MNRIRRGDKVQVIAGREKGKQGEILRVVAEGRRVVIQGVNVVKRHTRPTQANPKGGILEKEAPLDVSNVMLVDPKDGKPCRVGIEIRDGVRRRVSRRTGTAIGT